jgi:hypothetical protein
MVILILIYFEYCCLTVVLSISDIATKKYLTIPHNPGYPFIALRTVSYCSPIFHDFALMEWRLKRDEMLNHVIRSIRWLTSC